VPAELRCCVQRTSAFIAQECTVTCMRAHMIVKRVCAREGTSTETAFERPVISMRHQGWAKELEQCPHWYGFSGGLQNSGFSFSRGLISPRGLT
jgi:hypothetical protein